MDVTPILTLRTAPQVVFDQLAERADQPRFMLPEPDAFYGLATMNVADTGSIGLPGTSRSRPCAHRPRVRSLLSRPRCTAPRKSRWVWVCETPCRGLRSPWGDLQPHLRPVPDDSYW